MRATTRFATDHRQCIDRQMATVACCLGLSAALLAGCQDASAPVADQPQAIVQSDREQDCHEVFRTLDYPGAEFTRIFGVNDRGDLVGRFGDAEGNIHGFLKQPGGGFVQIDVDGSILTAAFAVNNQGVVAGHYVDGDGVTHGFLYRRGRFETVDYPGALDTRIRGIDDQGNVMGNFGSIADGVEHGFIRDRQGFHQEDLPGSETSDIWASDDEGHFVGDWSGTDDVVHGLILQHGRFTSFDMPGPWWATSPRTILHSGVVIGVVGETDFIAHGFIRQGDRYRQVDYPGAISTSTLRANNRGVVVGAYALTEDSPEHGFVLTSCLSEDR